MIWFCAWITDTRAGLMCVFSLFLQKGQTKSQWVNERVTRHQHQHSDCLLSPLLSVTVTTRQRLLFLYLMTQAAFGAHFDSLKSTWGDKTHKHNKHRGTNGAAVCVAESNGKLVAYQGAINLHSSAKIRTLSQQAEEMTKSGISACDL